MQVAKCYSLKLPFLLKTQPKHIYIFQHQNSQILECPPPSLKGKRIRKRDEAQKAIQSRPDSLLYRLMLKSYFINHHIKKHS